MFDNDLTIRYKSETGMEPNLELWEDEPLEHILITAALGMKKDFPLNDEDGMNVPTAEYVDWLEQEVLRLSERETELKEELENCDGYDQ